MARSVSINGRTYAWPKQPVVVVCIDGSEPDYTELAIKAGALPWLAKALTQGSQLYRRMRGAELHQSQQPLHRHRRAAGGARHLRQLFL